MNILNFVNTIFLNKNCKFEGQRLKKKWFCKNGYEEEYQFFVKNDILDSEKLYCYIYNVDNKCSCGKTKRFIGFQNGYTEFCEKCARTKNNVMKKSGNFNIEINKIPTFIKDKNGGYSITKIKRLSDETIKNIIFRTDYLEEATLSERIYHIEYNLYGLPICKLCGKKHNNFYSSKLGYKDYCKGKCSHDYNKQDRRKGLRKHFYNHFVEKFNSDDEYEIKLFSLDDYVKENDCFIKFKQRTYKDKN